MFQPYRRYHPHPQFGAANWITTIRAALTLVIAAFAFQGPSGAIRWTAGSIAGVIAVLDGVDGWLARRTGTGSAFGARYDMETDAAFLLVLSALVWRQGQAGPWVLLIGLMRYLFVAAGWLWPWLTGPLTPTWRGKTVAVIQMATLAIVLVVPPWLSRMACATALGLLLWSFAIDIGRLWRARPDEKDTTTYTTKRRR
jgi:phosphatidylglycerophosphate synthase